MSRWDDRNHDDYDAMLGSDEEARLLKKFDDYKELEKHEVKRRQVLEISDKRGTGMWGNRFIIAAIIQVAIITTLTISLLVTDFVYSDLNLMQLLSMSFGGPAKWFFFGYIMYMTLIVAIAVTAIFYNHVEVNLKKNFSGLKNILAWMNLIGVNIGGTMTTGLMIWVGLAGSGVTSIGNNVLVQTNLLDQFISPIATFVGVFAVGALAGGIGLFMVYFQKPTRKEYSSMQIRTPTTEFERL